MGIIKHMKQYIYIIVVFYMLPTIILSINIEPKAIGSVLFAYTLGLIALWVKDRSDSWISKIF